MVPAAAMFQVAKRLGRKSAPRPSLSIWSRFSLAWMVLTRL